MRAAVLYAPKDLRIEPVAAAPLGQGEVEVRIEAGGICGSDLHYYFDGGFGTVRLREPMILGHEIAGNSLPRRRRGRGREARPARRRQPEPPLRRMPLLRRGQAAALPRHALLRQRDALSPCSGGFREMLVCDAAQAVPVPATMSAAQAAFAEPFAVCLHAVNRAGPLLGKRVLVTGRRPDRRPDGDRGATRGRVGDRRDRCGGRTTCGREARRRRCDRQRLAEKTRLPVTRPTKATSTSCSKPPATRRRSPAVLPSFVRWVSWCRSGSRGLR